MAKQVSFGFKTPVRRNTKNVTGHKVGGELSGGEVKINYSNRLELAGQKSYEFKQFIDNDINLFLNPIAVLAIGCYIYPLNNCLVKLTIEIENTGISETAVYELLSGKWYSIGLDLEVDLSENSLKEKNVNYSLTFESNESNYIIDYSMLNYGLIDYQYFQDNDVYSHFSNSKKQICFPEQFYFDNEIIIDNSKIGNVVYKKSCNRCQRYLPINPFEEREALAFSNHCSTKAPCTHSNFSNYQIIENTVDEAQFDNLIKNTSYSLKDGYLYSYFGHQLECKACKKFYVNAALNHLRTSTQHREDSLRRRAVEQLTNRLLGLTWIYHKFRLKNKKEFDREIWNKFNKSCFKCKNEIDSPKEMHLDHTMPLAYLYPLDEHATCLCSTCNNEKRDKFPVHYYNIDELKKLSEITQLPIDLLSSTSSNEVVVEKLKENLIWFFEEFLTHEDYQKVREGKKAADSILHSIQKAVNNSKEKFNLIDEYTKLKG